MQLLRLIFKRHKNLEEFNFDFWGFTITELLVNDEVVDYRRDGIELTIVPSMPILADETVNIVISYQGRTS